VNGGGNSEADSDECAKNGCNKRSEMVARRNGQLKNPFVRFGVPEVSGDIKHTAGSVPIIQNIYKSDIY
jgi:hypothetical protein